MQAKLTTRPVERVIAAIQALDLESVKVRVTDPELGEGWTREYADSIEVAYKNYLTTLAKYQDAVEDILLSKDVDEFWHTHILHTMKYMDDCEKVFGRYLHHTPKTRAEKSAAMCGAAIQAKDAAMCGAAIRAENAAMCGAAIRTEEGAMCGAAIRLENAAMCGAAIGVENVAMCGAAIRTDQPLAAVPVPV